MATMTSLANVKDSRWLQLEVCREFQRNKCTRPDTECKFAHPASNVEVQNGRVIACYDSIKGRCNREKPPCKYFHPPQHLKDQLLINGRNHLALKNALLQQMPLQLPMPTAAPAGAATMVSPYSSLAWRMPIAYNSATAHGSHSALTVDYTKAANPYMPTLMASPYLTGLLPGMMATTAAEPTALMTPTTLISPQKRTDRLEDQSTLQQNTDTTGLTQHSSPVPASSVPTMPTSMPALSLSPMSMAAMGGYQTAAHAQSVSHATTLSPSSMVTAQALTAQAQAQLFVHQQQQQQQQQQQSVTSGTTAGGIGVGVGMGAHPAYASATPGTDVAAAAAATTGAPQAKKRARDAESDLLHLATLPGIVQYKRPALEKSGVPVYQPSATAAAAAAYQQAALALQMQQQFVPVSYLRYPGDVYRFS